MKWLNVNESLCVYIEVDDEGYEIISKDPNYYLKPELKQYYQTNGKNIIITLLISENKKDIFKGLDILSGKYERVGFWNRGHQKFYQRGG
jgi:hypothetical protein